MTRHTGLVITLALLTAGALVTTTSRTRAEGDLPMAKAETVGMSTKRLERIHDYIQGYMDRNEIAGAVTLVARHGKVVHFEAQGFRDKEDHAPMQKDTIFSLMSMTKPIVSTALMMLWEEGRFLLDDPIARWLPSYSDKQVMEQGKLVKAKPVTIRHILTHTSGLSLTGTDGPAVENALASQEQRDAALQARQRQAQSQPQPAQAEDAGRGDRARRPAAAQLPAGQPVAVRIVHRLCRGAGREDDQHDDRPVRARAHVPAARHARHLSTTFRERRSGASPTVYRPDQDGHITILRKPEYREPTTYFPGVAGLNGTAADYFRFAQMLLNGGEYDGQRLLGRMTVNQMFSNQIGTGKTVYVRGEGWGFGLGAGVLTDPATIGRRSVDRHLVVGRRRRDALLHRPAGRSRGAADGAAQSVRALADPPQVLERRLTGDRRQHGRSKTAGDGLRHAPVVGAMRCRDSVTRFPDLRCWWSLEATAFHEGRRTRRSSATSTRWPRQDTHDVSATRRPAQPAACDQNETGKTQTLATSDRLRFPRLVLIAARSAGWSHAMVTPCDIGGCLNDRRAHEEQTHKDFRPSNLRRLRVLRVLRAFVMNRRRGSDPFRVLCFRGHSRRRLRGARRAQLLSGRRGVDPLLDDAVGRRQDGGRRRQDHRDETPGVRRLRHHGADAAAAGGAAGRAAVLPRATGACWL